jgi:hypothetical protein
MNALPASLLCVPPPRRRVIRGENALAGVFLLSFSATALWEGMASDDRTCPAPHITRPFREHKIRQNAPLGVPAPQEHHWQPSLRQISSSDGRPYPAGAH